MEHIDVMTPYLAIAQQLDGDGDETENVNICSSDEDDTTKMEWSALQVHALRSSISLRQYTAGWTPSLRDDREEILARVCLYLFFFFTFACFFLRSLISIFSYCPSSKHGGRIRRQISVQGRNSSMIPLV